MDKNIKIRFNLDKNSEYEDVWQKMRDFTEARHADTQDEIWVLQHTPVFTLGLAGKREHILNTSHNIPIIHCDRGGQVTYHAPGQLVIYTLIDLKRLGISIRELVERLEKAIIQYLAIQNIHAVNNKDAPGVYVDGGKIASLGLKVRKNCTYHGLSFNVNMDLTPFNHINVCGYSNLKVVNLNSYINVTSIDDVAHDLLPIITNALLNQL